ncbi:collagen alpha-1(XII) chain-like isoform X2 [Amphiura filiformis]|uniref:collagen alpha-1(XII) chain-like isoform X2 n=1 Tax=Amphiura filiformis TaxID=82378 RepID=UPI003B217F8F
MASGSTLLNFFCGNYINREVVCVLVFTYLVCGIYAVYPVTTKKATTKAATTATVPTYGAIEVTANSTAVHVSWQLIQGAIEYHVVYGPSSNNEEKIVEIVKGNTNSAWLSSTPNTMYTIEVVARLPQNVLKHVGAMDITTDNDIFVTEVTSTSVSIWWGVVDSADEYHVLYHPSKDSVKSTALIVRTTQKLITDLQPSTEYIIEVVAILEETERFQPIGEVTITTKPDALNIPLIAGSAAGGLVLLVIVAIIVYCWCCRRRK